MLRPGVFRGSGTQTSLIVVAVAFPTLALAFLSSGLTAAEESAENIIGKMGTDTFAVYPSVEEGVGFSPGGALGEAFSDSDYRKVKSLSCVSLLARICVKFKELDGRTVLVIGTDPELFDIVPGLERRKGRVFIGGKEAIVGAHLDYKVGEHFNLSGEDWKVVGKLSEIGLSFSPMDTALFVDYEEVCEWAVTFRGKTACPPERTAQQIKAVLGRKYGNRLTVLTASSLASVLGRVLDALKLAGLIFSAGVFAAGGASASAVMRGIAREQRRTVGILRALGMTAEEVFLTFCVDMLPVLVVGFLPPIFAPGLLGLPWPHPIPLLGILLVLSASLLLPAKEASEVSPSEALRYE